MKKIYLSALAVLFSSIAWSTQPFTPGNVVILRVGDGVASDGYAVPSFLDEYKMESDGGLTFVQSLPLPIEENGANKRVTFKGTANLMGAMTRSEDGRYLVVPGHNAAVGTDCAQAEKVGALVDWQGNIDATTTLPSYKSGDKNTLNEFRGATSVDGSGIYFSGSKVDYGMYYVPKGGNVGVGIYNGGTLRDVRIYDGQLYGNNDVTWFTMGDGVVTEGVITTETRGEAFIHPLADDGNTVVKGFCDLCILDVPGGKVAYIATTGSSAGTVPTRGVVKFSLVDGAWIYNGRTPAMTNCHGLCGKVDETGKVSMYVTIGNGDGTDTDASDTEWNEERIAMFTDNSGYNSAEGLSSIQFRTVLKADPHVYYRAITPTPVQNAISHVATTTNTSIQISAVDGSICVAGVQGQMVEVYNLLGCKVAQQKNAMNQVFVKGLPANKIYLVKVGDEVRKICL